jgi:integrase/recombinase XerD
MADFRDRRDEAILRLMAETGMRAGELLDLTVGDVDLVRGIVAVRRGKGGKGRLAPFAPQTGGAVDRYIRARRGHVRADFSRVMAGTGRPPK